MRHFMSHDSGELRFVTCRCDSADIHEHRPSGQRKRIDLLLGDDVKLKRPGAVCGNSVHQPFAERLYILRLRTGIRLDRHLLVHLCGNLQPKLLLLVASHTGLSGVGKFRGAGGRKTLSCRQAYRHTNWEHPWIS